MKRRLTALCIATAAAIAIAAPASVAAPGGTNGTTCDPYYGPVGTAFPADYTGTCTRTYNNGKSCSTSYVNGQIVSSTCPGTKSKQ